MAGFTVHNAPLNAEEYSTLKQHYVTVYAFSAGRMKLRKDCVDRGTHVRSGSN
jgi:hypothetical protein